MFRTSGRALIVTALSTAVLATGLAGHAGAKSATVKVDINDDGCPAKLTIKSGPTTFKVSNSGSGDVSEFEILKGDHVIGEVENVAPGLNKEFSLTLKPGTYHTLCPGGSEHSKGKLVVKGKTAKLTAAGQSAVDQYR
jgi:iron uptake system component EfeO